MKFLVRWLPQPTLVPSFFYLSLFLSLSLSLFPPFFHLHVIYQVKGISGHQWVCVGCVRVCKSVRGCARVCGGVHRRAQVCVDMYGCGMYFQNFFWRIESLHQRTLICILYKFFSIERFFLLYSKSFTMLIHKLMVLWFSKPTVYLQDLYHLFKSIWQIWP